MATVNAVSNAATTTAATKTTAKETEDRFLRLLVTQMKISQLDDHNLHLALEEKMADGSTTRAFEVTLGLPIIHALLHLLDLVIKSADWGLTPVPGVPASEPSPGMDAFETAERPQYLN